MPGLEWEAVQILETPSMKMQGPPGPTRAGLDRLRGPWRTRSAILGVRHSLGLKSMAGWPVDVVHENRP